VLSTRFAEVKLEEYLLQKSILHFNLPEWSTCNEMLPKTLSVPKKINLKKESKRKPTER
jgi:hypothetical protein